MINLGPIQYSGCRSMRLSTVLCGEARGLERKEDGVWENRNPCALPAGV